MKRRVNKTFRHKLLIENKNLISKKQLIPKKKRNKKSANNKMFNPINGKVKILVLLFLFFIFIIVAFFWTERTIKPALNSAAEISTKSNIEKIVNSTVYTVTSNESDEIIYIQKDSNGSITMVTLNTKLLNRIGTEIAKTVNNEISMHTIKEFKISIGSLLGSKLLSQITPYLTFNISPVAVSDVSYTTEFEGMGINQTKYKVFMTVKTQARVLVPFMSDKIETENTVLIAEAVIIGSVPDTYANIPEDDLSDYVS